MKLLAVLLVLALAHQTLARPDKHHSGWDFEDDEWENDNWGDDDQSDELTQEEVEALLEACSEIADLEPTTLDEVFAQIICAIISEEEGWDRKKRAVRNVRSLQKKSLKKRQSDDEELTEEELEALLEACSEIAHLEPTTLDEAFAQIICAIISEEGGWDRKKRAVRNVRSLQKKSLKKRQSDDEELTQEELEALLEACSEIAHLEPTTLDEVFAQLICAIISEEEGWDRKKRAVRKIRGAQNNLKQLKHKK